MAELEVGDGELVLRLSAVEKAEGIHRDLHVPLSAVRSVEVIDDTREMTRVKTGFKVGMRVPGSASVAVVRRPGHTMFVAVHHNTPRGVRILLQGDAFDEWIVGAADPESVVAIVNEKLKG